MPENTQEWINEYLKFKGGTTLKNRATLDRKELYNYEAEIGKPLFEMNVEELRGLLAKYRTVNGNPAPARYQSTHQITSMLRGLFDFYINHEDGEIIRNPWSDPRLRGAELVKYLASVTDNDNEDAAPFSKQKMDAIIADIYANYPKERAQYIECIMQMFYCGFADAKEILLCKKIESGNLAVTDKHIVRIKDRCRELMEAVHNMQIMPADGNYTPIMESWDGSYLKFPTNIKDSGGNDARDIDSMRAKVYEVINKWVCKNLGYDFNYRTLYMLGFYDNLVEQYGEERTQRLITSTFNQEDVDTMKSAARKYGLYMENISHIKRNLMRFVKC